MFFLVLGVWDPRHSLCSVSPWTWCLAFFLFFVSTDENKSVAKKAATIVRHSSILRSRQRESSTICRVLKNFEDGGGRPAFAVKQFAIDLEFRYLYMMIYVALKSRPRSIVSILHDDIVGPPNDIRYLFIPCQSLFPNSCQEIFLLEYLRQKLYATKQFSNEAIFALVETSPRHMIAFSSGLKSCGKHKHMQECQEVKVREKK